MTDDPSLPENAAPGAERKTLTPAAQRALAEAEASLDSGAALNKLNSLIEFTRQ